MSRTCRHNSEAVQSELVGGAGEVGVPGADADGSLLAQIEDVHGARHDPRQRSGAGLGVDQRVPRTVATLLRPRVRKRP